MPFKKQLRLFDLTMIVVSFVIGMGIFRTPVNVAAATPTPLVFFLCWIAGGVVALSGALTYSEIGSRLPVTGGYYKVFSYAYHPSIAFAINCIILVSNAASLAAVALVGSEYIVSVLRPNTNNIDSIKNWQIAVAIFSISLFYAVNLMGLKMSAKTQNVLMVIKIGLVILLILPLFFQDTHAAITVSKTTVDIPTREYVKAFGIGLVAVSFTFGGYQQTINFGEEVHQPHRTIPKGIFWGIAIIVILYLLINIAYVQVIGFENLKTSKNIAALMASKILGPQAEMVLSVLLFLGVLAYINSSLMSNPRVMYAMGADKVFPTVFTHKNAREAMVWPLTIFALLSAFIVFFAKEFDHILSFTIFLDCFGMALSAGSIFYIRKKTAHLNGTGIYSMKLFPLLPLIFIVAYTFVAISIAWDYEKNNYAALIGISVLALFIIIYFIFHGSKERK